MRRLAQQTYHFKKNGRRKAAIFHIIFNISFFSRAMIRFSSREM